MRAARRGVFRAARREGRCAKEPHAWRAMQLEQVTRAYPGVRKKGNKGWKGRNKCAEKGKGFPLSFHERRAMSERER